MEINDRVFTNKILSEAKSSRHFNVILKNNSRIELWKIPALAVYACLLSIGLLSLVAILWLSNIQRPQTLSHFFPVNKLKANTSLQISRMVQVVSGEVEITSVDVSPKNLDLILSITMRKALPTSRGYSQRVSSKLVNTKGSISEQKIPSVWRSTLAKNSSEKSSVIKLLIPKAAYENSNSQKIEVSAIENEEISFVFSVNLAALKEDLGQIKNLSQVKNRALTKN